MSSSPLNNANPPVASVSNLSSNPCYDVDSGVAALMVFADEGINYIFPYAQFLYAKRMPNPDLEKEPDASPEKMLIHFATAEVVVLGSGLIRVEQGILKYELKFVRAVGRSPAAALKVHVAAINVIFNKEIL
jgi:hypothetical protein